MFQKGCMIALLLAGSVAAPASAQYGVPHPASPQNPLAVLRGTPLLGLESGLRFQVELLRREHEEARLALEQIRKDFRNPAPELKQAEERYRAAQVTLREAEDRLAKETRLAILQRPLDLRLTDASLRQAAVALTEAAGVPVVVDENILADKRLTLDAKGVTLGLILEAVAGKVDLMIAPDPKGIRFRQWPTLEVDGQRLVKRGGLAPWSEEWTGYLVLGDPAAANSPFASGGGVLFSGGAPEGFAVEIPVAPPPRAAGAPPAPAPVPVPAPAPAPRIEVQPFNLRVPYVSSLRALGGGLGGVSLAPVGDRNVVVAEPGVSESGEAGYWLTVYRLDGERLRKLSSTFHPAASQGARIPPGMVPVYPGFVRPVPAPRRPPRRVPPQPSAPTAPVPPRALPAEPTPVVPPPAPEAPPRPK